MAGVGTGGGAMTGQGRRHAVALMGFACAAVLAGLAFLAACGGPTQDVPGGDPGQGRQAIARYGCGSCHEIAGVAGADGKVGPPLTGIADRQYIAGMLPNTPENLVHWIRDPQAVVPGNVMPDMGVTEPDARDIAAYLYTLR